MIIAAIAEAEGIFALFIGAGFFLVAIGLAALVRTLVLIFTGTSIEATVALFAPDGAIVMQGETYQGETAIREAHEYDRESHTQIRLDDFQVDDAVIRCSFWNEHQLDRVIGTDGTMGKAEFIVHDSRISSFTILPPERAEMQRIMEKAAPVFQWLRENHPETVAKWQGFDGSAGKAVAELAALWQQHGADV